jgi:hypothetical protein
MPVENIKPIVSPRPVAADPALKALEVEYPPRHTAPQIKVEDQTSFTGQFTLEGVTAYYSVKRGNIAVFQLVEDSTGKVIREVPPEQMMQISSAIDQILSQNRESGPPAVKK